VPAQALSEWTGENGLGGGHIGYASAHWEKRNLRVTGREAQ